MSNEEYFVPVPEYWLGPGGPVFVAGLVSCKILRCFLAFKIQKKHGAGEKDRWGDIFGFVWSRQQ